MSYPDGAADVQPPDLSQVQHLCAKCAPPGLLQPHILRVLQPVYGHAPDLHLKAKDLELAQHASFFPNTDQREGKTPPSCIIPSADKAEQGQEFLVLPRALTVGTGEGVQESQTSARTSCRSRYRACNSATLFSSPTAAGPQRASRTPRQTSERCSSSRHARPAARAQFMS